MTDISTANLDAGADSPRLARAQLLEVVQRINNIRAQTSGNGATHVGFLQSGTGASGRTAQDKGRERITPEDFGADPTGAADSTAALRSWFAACRGKQGTGNPGATYRVSGTIGTTTVTTGDFADNTTLDFRGATLLVNYSALPSGVTSIITLEGNNVAVKNARFTSTQVFEQYNTDPATYRSKIIIGVTIGGKAASYNSIADSLSYYKKGALVEGCEFTDIHSPIILTQTARARVLRNTVSSYNQTAIVVWGCTDDIEVAGNNIKLGADEGVVLYNPKASQSAWVTAGNDAGNIRVHHNYVGFTRASFIGTGGYSDVLIDHNTCEMSLLAGIRVMADPAVFATGATYNRDINIRGNVIKRAGRFYNTTSGYAYWQGPVSLQNVGIGTNAYKGTRGSSVLPLHVTIADNTIDNPHGTAIQAWSVDTVTIRGNTVRPGTMNQGAGNVATTGFAFQTSDVSNVVIAENRSADSDGAAWLNTYAIDATSLTAGTVKIKWNAISEGETFFASNVLPSSGLIDYDPLPMSGATSYAYNKQSPGDTSNPELASWGYWGENPAVSIRRGVWGTPSGTAAAMWVRQHSTSGRSINASGTINASGADYAEYELKRPDCGVIRAGDVCGFDAAGLLTDQFGLAVSFAIKSTAPAIVGGDDWGAGLEGEELETARARVDRIAYCGKVPVNVTGAAPGDWIDAAEGPGGSIVGVIADAPGGRTVGRVRAVLPDGRALVVVL